MGKKQQSFFERLMEKNAIQQEMNKPQETIKNTKKKNHSWKLIVAGSVLGASIVSAITIPLVVNSTYVKTKPALADDSKLYTYNIDGKTYTYTLKQIQELAKSNNQYLNNSAKISEVAKQAIYWLYEQEQKASKEYQRLWNLSLQSGETINENLALKSIDEIKTKHRNLLKDAESGYKSRYGAKTWEGFFKEFLSKNYDKAKTIDEAIEKETFKEIRKDALRRFELSSDDKSSEIDRTANSNIYKLDANGKATSEILVKKGEKVFKFYKKDENYFRKVKNGKEIGKAHTFMTKSFVNEWKDASIFLKEYFATKKPYIFNSFVLPGTAPTKEKEEWKADRKAIKYLFSYWLMNKKNNAFDYEYKQGYEWLKETFDSLENFMNIKDSDVNAWKKQTYNTLLTDKETFSLDSSTNYGSTGITSGLSLFGKDNLDLGLSLLEKAFSSVDAANIKEIDLFGELKKIANEMVTDLGGNVSPTFDYIDKNKEEANKKAALEYGQKIEEAINPLKSDSKPKYDDDKYKTMILEKIKKIFVDTNGKYNTIYKVKDLPDTWLVLTSKGIKLIKYKKVESVEQLKEFIKKDYETKIQNEDSKLPIPSFNVIKAINTNLANDLNIVDTLIGNNDFRTFMKTKENIFNLKNTLETKEKYTDQDLNDISAAAKTMKTGQAKKLVLDSSKAITEWLKKQLENKLNSNFKQDDDNKKIYLAKADGTYDKSKTAEELLLNHILKLFDIEDL